MPDRCTDRYDIALLGGGDFCREVLETYVPQEGENGFSARIVAVADPQPESPGIIFAKELGLITARDYRQLYDPQYDIRALVLLTPEDSLLQDVLKTKPPRIRLVSYQVFRLFWTAVGAEHQKLQRRNQEIETILNGIQDFIIVLPSGHGNHRGERRLHLQNGFCPRGRHRPENATKFFSAWTTPCGDEQDGNAP